MKTFARLLLGLGVAAGLSFGCAVADAATFAELPLINNASAKMDEQDAAALENISQVYYNKIMSVLETQNEYTMADDDSVQKAIEKSAPKDSVPSKEVLMQIAQDAGVDVVFAMQIDDMNDKKIFGRKENTVLLTMRGKVVAYNQLTGKYYQSKVYEDIEMEEIYIPRGNWKMNEFSKVLGREVRHVLNIKKFRVEKPRIAKIKI